MASLGQANRGIAHEINNLSTLSRRIRNPLRRDVEMILDVMANFIERASVRTRPFSQEEYKEEMDSLTIW